METNREVFAVPGSLFNGNSKGCHALIRDGAKLVDSVESILEELNPGEECTTTIAAGRVREHSAAGSSPRNAAPLKPSVNQKAEPLKTAERALLQQLGHDPCPADSLAERSGKSIEEVTRLLVSLELKGLVVQEGGRFQRMAPGHGNGKFDPD